MGICEQMLRQVASNQLTRVMSSSIHLHCVIVRATFVCFLQHFLFVHGVTKYVGVFKCLLIVDKSAENAADMHLTATVGWNTCSTTPQGVQCPAPWSQAGVVTSVCCSSLFVTSAMLYTALQFVVTSFLFVNPGRGKRTVHLLCERTSPVLRVSQSTCTANGRALFLFVRLCCSSGLFLGSAIGEGRRQKRGL